MAKISKIMLNTRHEKLYSIADGKYKNKYVFQFKNINIS